MDSKVYVIKTFRGYEEIVGEENAVSTAKDMIMDIITDGISADFWWAVILSRPTGSMKYFIECPMIGIWNVQKSLGVLYK